jgi:hypothetical protein
VVREQKMSQAISVGATLSAEQHYVHPQPSAWSPFALHLFDEVLAFF